MKDVLSPFSSSRSKKKKKSLHETCCLLDWHNAFSQFRINFEPKNGSPKSWVDIFVWECQKALLCTCWVHAEEHWMGVPHLGAHSPRFSALCCLWRLEPETSFLNIPVLEMQKSGISPCTKLPDLTSPKCQREDCPPTQPCSKALLPPLGTLCSRWALGMQQKSQSVPPCKETVSLIQLAVENKSLFFRLIVKLVVFFPLSHISWPSYLANFVLSTQHSFKLISKPALVFFLPTHVSLRKLSFYFPKYNNLIIWLPNTQVLKISISSPWYFSVQWNIRFCSTFPPSFSNKALFPDTKASTIKNVTKQL